MVPGKSNSPAVHYGHFDLAQISASHSLVISLENDRMHYAVLDRKQKICELLKTFPIGNSNSKELIIRALANEGLLDKSFSKRSLIIDHRKCAFIPEMIYKEEDKLGYLQLSFDAEEQDNVIAVHLGFLKAYFVYHLPSSVKALVDKELSAAELYHSTALNVERLFHVSKGSNESILYADFSQDHFDLYMMEQGKLHFYNSFNYQTSEDIAYFTMYALDQWQQKVQHMLISGIFNSESEEIHWLKRYIPSIADFPADQLTGHPEAIENSSAYIALLNPALCV